MSTSSASYYTAADLDGMGTKLRKHFNAIIEVFYCFTASIGLPGDVSEYNEDKRSAVAAHM